MFMELYREEKREKEDRGDQEEKRGSQKEMGGDLLQKAGEGKDHLSNGSPTAQ